MCGGGTLLPNASCASATLGVGTCPGHAALGVTAVPLQHVGAAGGSRQPPARCPHGYCALGVHPSTAL